MATKIVSRENIREHMPVVCSNSKQFGTVDRVEGDYIKLTKDDKGQHHWIPMSWVTGVDQSVHVDRPGDQAMREWLSSPPTEIQSMHDMPAASVTHGSDRMHGMEGQEGASR